MKLIIEIECDNDTFNEPCTNVRTIQSRNIEVCAILDTIVDWLQKFNPDAGAGLFDRDGNSVGQAEFVP